MMMLCVFESSPRYSNEVAPADIEHGADGNEGAETDHFALAPVENRGAERAALADEGDAAGTGDFGGEGGIQTDVGVHQSETIRSDNAEVVLAGLGQDGLFQRRAGWPRFLETGRDDDCRANPGASAIGDHGGNRGGGSGDDGEIDLVRDLSNTRVALRT